MAEGRPGWYWRMSTAWADFGTGGICATIGVLGWVNFASSGNHDFSLVAGIGGLVGTAAFMTSGVARLRRERSRAAPDTPSPPDLPPSSR